MRHRAGVWIFCLIALIGMTGGAFLALRPFLFRKTIVLVSLLPKSTYPAESKSIARGVTFALEENGYRAGRHFAAYEDFDESMAHVGSTVYADAVAQEADRVFENSDNSMAWLGRRGAIAYVILPGMKEPALYPTWPDDGKFQALPHPADEGSYAADWAAELGAKNVFVAEWRAAQTVPSKLRVKKLPRSDLAVGFSYRARELGIGVHAGPEVDPEGIDLVYLEPGTRGSEIIGDLRRRGFQGPIIASPGSLPRDALRSLGERAEGVRFVTGIKPGPIPSRFRDAYAARFGTPPDPYAWAGYRRCRAVLDTFDRVGPKSCGAIRSAFESMGSLDAEPDALDRALGGYLVRNGRPELVEIFR